MTTAIAPAPAADPPKTGEKCGYDTDDVSSALLSMAPYLGGATSFADADAYDRANESQQAVMELTTTFLGIVGNVFDPWMHPELDLGKKADLIIAAAGDLKKRISTSTQPPITGEKAALERLQAIKEHAGDRVDGTGLLTRFKERLRRGPSTKEREAATMAAEPPEADHSSSPPLSASGGSPNSFRAFKDQRGDYRWIATFTNNFEDREGETFPMASHKAYEEWVDRTGVYPELRVWHIPGSRLGPADLVALDDGGFMVATGTFDPGMNEAAERLAGMKGLAVSHGYYYDEKSDDGVFGRYQTFEISVLPSDRAANEMTGFAVEEVTMLPAAKKELLVRVVGQQTADGLEASLGQLGAAARAKGLASKELTDLGSVLSAGVMAGFKDDAPESTQATPPAALAASESAPAPGGGDAATALAAALTEALKPFSAQLESIAGEVKELKKTDDERMSQRFAPRTGMVFPTSVGREVAPPEGMKETEPETAPKHLVDALSLMGVALQPAN